jgi:hypothetical protein
MTAVLCGDSIVPWVGTITKPFEDDEYLLLHDIRKAIEIKVRTAAIKVSLIRILRFISM